jgi:hypothetical protein
VQLLAEREVLEDQFAMSAEGQHEPADQDEDDLQHASILSVSRAQMQPITAYGVDFGDGQRSG